MTYLEEAILKYAGQLVASWLEILVKRSHDVAREKWDNDNVRGPEA